MKTFVHIGDFNIPSYGLAIIFGIITANIIAFALVKHLKLDQNDFIILEAYSFLGAFLGAKLLYLWVSRSEIQWSRIAEPDYFNMLMQGGFVFYGGLLGGLFLVFLSGKIHKIDALMYIRNFIFLIPWIHCFGRIGCFFAGCCYGVPYEGIFAVVFPLDSLALSGIKLLPIQLIEAIFLMIISVIILICQLMKKTKFTIEIYLLSYGILRFVLEYFRYDYVRGKFLVFSTSQWISILIVCVVLLIHIWRFVHKKLSA